ELPSIAVPSEAASLEAPSLGAGATPTAGCIGPFMAMIFGALQQQGVDVQGLLQQNRDALIAALQTWAPEDSGRATWSAQLAAALQAKDYTAAAAKIEQLK